MPSQHEFAWSYIQLDLTCSYTGIVTHAMQFPHATPILISSLVVSMTGPELTGQSAFISGTAAGTTSTTASPEVHIDLAMP